MSKYKYTTTLLGRPFWDEFDSWFNTFDLEFKKQKSLKGDYSINLAGYSKDDIKVEQEGNILYIIAENKHRGKKEYQYTLYDGDVVKNVRYEHGLLYLSIEEPKAEKSERKQLKIQ